MAEFTEQQKEFVIRCWACDMDGDDIAKEFVEQFSTEEVQVPRPPSGQLARYKLGNVNCSLSPAHRALYNKARKAFREDLSTIPIAHKAYRIRELLTLYKKQKKKSDVIAADLLEQAAKEMGGLFERPEPSGSPAEIAAYMAGVNTQLRAAVERHVTNPDEVKRVTDEMAEIMAKENK